jgi:hypothetical protein
MFDDPERKYAPSKPQGAWSPESAHIRVMLGSDTKAKWIRKLLLPRLVTVLLLVSTRFRMRGLGTVRHDWACASGLPVTIKPTTSTTVAVKTKALRLSVVSKNFLPLVI